MSVTENDSIYSQSLTAVRVMFPGIFLANTVDVFVFSVLYLRPQIQDETIPLLLGGCDVMVSLIVPQPFDGAEFFLHLLCGTNLKPIQLFSAVCRGLPKRGVGKT